MTKLIDEKLNFMNLLSHSSAKPSHYDKDSENYDTFNETTSARINDVIENILKKHKVQTVLDLTCGTGSQALWLAKRGFDVVGSDFNTKMLKIAENKTREEKLEITFLQGDMRTKKVGKFDAVITIFNAVGHLTKLDFEKAMRNIYENLKDGGLYVFDINNLSYLKKDNNITTLTIDWQKIVENKTVRVIQYSTIDKSGILASYTTFHELESSKPKISRSAQTLQVYSAKQLEEMLHRNGFKVLYHCGINGSKFTEDSTECIMTIAQKE